MCPLMVKSCDHTVYVKLASGLPVTWLVYGVLFHCHRVSSLSTKTKQTISYDVIEIRQSRGAEER
jgi:hypothetical protein